MTPIFRGQAHRGKVVFEDRAAFDLYVASLDGDIEVVVRRRRPLRSLNQNAYYWSVVIGMVAEYTGHEANEVHESFKLRFLGEGGSTATLNTAQMSLYIERCRQLAAEMDVVTPDPGQAE